MPPYIAPELNARVGQWGRPTATLDWCEENYLHTYYIAEFWNTLSNVAMIIPALVGLWTCSKYSLERRYVFTYLGLLLVGIGSALFHGTLLYSMQLLDELPMLILSSFILFSLYEMGQPHRTRNTRTFVTIAILIAYPTIVSMVYIFVNDPTFHEVAYGIMVVAITVQGFYCLKHQAVPSGLSCNSRAQWVNTHGLGNLSGDPPEGLLVCEAGKLVYKSGNGFHYHIRVKYNSWRCLYPSLASFVIYIFGFVLWNIDNNLCPGLRDMRKTAPYIVATMTQFHSWWHFFAGFGTYLQIVISSRVRMEHLKRSCSIKFVCGIPYLEVSQRKLQ